MQQDGIHEAPGTQHHAALHNATLVHSQAQLEAVALPESLVKVGACHETCEFNEEGSGRRSQAGLREDSKR